MGEFCMGEYNIKHGSWKMRWCLVLCPDLFWGDEDIATVLPHVSTVLTDQHPTSHP